MNNTVKALTPEDKLLRAIFADHIKEKEAVDKRLSEELETIATQNIKYNLAFLEDIKEWTENEKRSIEGYTKALSDYEANPEQYPDVNPSELKEKIKRSNGYMIGYAELKQETLANIKESRELLGQ